MHPLAVGVADDIVCHGPVGGRVVVTRPVAEARPLVQRLRHPLSLCVCRQRAAQLLAGITTVSKDVTQPRRERTDPGDHGAVAILDVGGMNLQPDQVAGPCRSRYGAFGL